MGTEGAPVRVLVVEGSEQEAELTVAELRRAGLRVEALRVDAETGLVAAVDGSAWDLVLAGVAARRELQESADRRRRAEVEQALAAQQRRYSRLFGMGSIALFELDLSALPALVRELRPTFERADLGALFRDHPSLLERLVDLAVVRDANDEAVRVFDARTKDALLGPIGRAASLGPKAGLARAIEALAQDGGRVQRELSLSTLTGKAVSVILTAQLPAEVEDLGRVVVGALDVTDRRRLEEQMRAAQRMESIGQLAGGIAHDFNNLLTVISNYTQFMLAKMPVGSDARSDAEVIRDATERATALTGQLLTFSRGELRRLGAVDPNEIVGGLRKIVERLVGEDVEFVFDLAPDLKGVDLDPLHLEQVLMNLVVNARDAMPRGGRITVETRDVTATSPRTPGERRFVRLRVSDTGIGMDETTRARIFEPFFTTKDRGKGTGLGLATVSSVVEQAGGFVVVESAPGAGTSVEVYLPPSDAQRPRVVRRARMPSARGSETVLVVEDQDLVRRTSTRILEAAGFKVLLSSHAGEAIQVAAAHPGPIHCILTDVVMPGMNVLDAIAELLASHPEARVIFTSGYAGDVLSGRGVTPDSVNYLPKPFTADALLRKVRDVLDQSS